ncbi:porin [Ramlibacter sp. PS4R-6]|uniref:porin n=1 Tax=Ramlibacter sp. PS4R-6 TaxID=3133438 RepID=UPI0030A52928
MKKLAPIAAAAFLACGFAQAQTSSVQIFGLLDLNVGHYTGGGVSQTVLGTDGYQSSRLGFRGQEDLGGGLQASFWLESGINPDSGTGGTTNTNNQSTGGAGGGGIVFGRRSTVSLSGAFGELRLGRDYTPGFWNLSNFHPFGTNGVGSAGILFYPVQGGARITNVRASNSIGYFLPKMSSGIYGQAMYAIAENLSTSATRQDGRLVGIRLGYAGGPIDAAFGYSKTTLTPVGDFTQINLGGTYDFGMAKVFALWGQNKVGATKTKPWNIGVHVPVGAGVIRAAYGRVKTTGVANDAGQFTVGYLHNLSKRTALYTNFSAIDNKGTGTNYNVGAPVTVPGGNSRGYEAGIRHSF